MEILAIAHYLGYEIKTIDIKDWVDKPDGAFEEHMTTAAFMTLGELALIWWRRLMGRYNNPTFKDTVE